MSALRIALSFLTARFFSVFIFLKINASKHTDTQKLSYSYIRTILLEAILNFYVTILIGWVELEEERLVPIKISHVAVA